VSAPAAALDGQPWIDLPADVDGAVDGLDATARLESQGIGDAVAVRAGHDSIFALADACLAATPPPTEGYARQPLGLVAALARVLVMMSSVVICLMMVPTLDWSGTGLVAGAASWISGQAVSASLWWGRGAGREVQGTQGALAVTLLMMAIAAPVAGLVGEPAIVGWAAWGCAVTVALYCVDHGRLAAITVGGAALAVAGLALPAWQSLPADAVVAVACCWAVRVLVLRSGGWRPRRLVPRQAHLIGLALVQTFAHLYLLLVLYDRVGPRFPLVLWAGLASTAISEPLLVLATATTRRLAASHHLWRRVRRDTGLAGVVAVLTVGAVGTDAANAAALITTGLPTTGVVYASALAVTVLTSGCGILLRTGSAGGAAALAVSGALVVTVVPAGNGPIPPLVALAGSFLIALIAGRRFASPGNW